MINSIAITLLLLGSLVAYKKNLKGNQYCLVLNVLHKIAVVQSTPSL